MYIRTGLVIRYLYMFEIIRKNIGKFIILWLIILIVSFAVLSLLGLVPEEEKDVIIKETPSVESLDEKLANISIALPQRVVIDEIGVDININNPQSRNIDVLDVSLNAGVVRYPSSGLLGQKTNMLLFGHSSHLPIVRNRSYKAFNDLEDLEIGSKVSIFSGTHQFIYIVKSAEEANAENALVIFESDKREITLSTCNSFGNLDDRFIVKADLVDVREI